MGARAQAKRQLMIVGSHRRPEPIFESCGANRATVPQQRLQLGWGAGSRGEANAYTQRVFAQSAGVGSCLLIGLIQCMEA